MALTTLALFMTGMWAMILAIAAFLVVFVAPIEVYLFGGHGERLTISAVPGSNCYNSDNCACSLIGQIKENLPTQETPTLKYCSRDSLHNC